MSSLVVAWKRLQQYCSVYSCCYATIARRNMRCLVKAGKHVNDTRAVARQLLDKCVPAETVSMQRRGKHASITIEEFLGNDVLCWIRPEAV
jgi:hypothetical protein